ncbi:MAG: GH116 family glycosyl hydrolase, partial [Bacteroidia bacterium]|nr:GH116 family glycosyl hydrolase [Bacteroidia bacterium]
TTGESVFAPFTVSKSSISNQFIMKALTYDEEYDRGVLKGIKEESVNEILNTIGRYGVVDKNLYGSNGWRTGWAVLQEPWLALFGNAINAPDFINGFSQALEYAKEHAIMPDGRVLPRWHHDSTDAMPNTFRPDGFYECQWGYMLDAQPAFAINVAEQFDLTGDIAWLRRFKPTCEKVLDYMIKRDSDGNGLFEVVQKTHKENKGTDWLDVVWASYEVSTINAFMYKALIRWSELEALLGDQMMSDKYLSLAKKLKTTFNKNIADGGFWDPKNSWYVHWREADGSVYGNNLVSVVNFLAIGYGVCDDPVRKTVITSRIEELMQKEKLFVWPACFFPYEENVGLLNVNYPWPNYENGDLFLAWAELGTRCYAENNPETAVKYIRNVISQYEKDGLGFQRYTRVKQTGAGDDILSNNIMAIVGLYRNIYGIRPQYNRLYLEPHLTKELNGTKIKYWLRNQDYVIDLSKEKYSIAANSFSASSTKPFAVNITVNKLEYFNAGDPRISMSITGAQSCFIEIVSWEDNNRQWKEIGSNPKRTIHHELLNLKPDTVYQLLVNDKPLKQYTSDAEGIIHFEYPVDHNILNIQVK